jgi:hypothetical protein
MSVRLIFTVVAAEAGTGAWSSPCRSSSPFPPSVAP